MITKMMIKEMYKNERRKKCCMQRDFLHHVQVIAMPCSSSIIATFDF